MCEWNWAVILTITGAVFEGVGLSLVFIELAFIRSQEFGTAPPWSRAAARIRVWVRRLLRRPQVVHLGQAHASAEGAMSIRGIVRPGDPKPDATESERIERLERYVKLIDEDLSEAWSTMREHRDAAIQEARRRDEEVQQEIAQRERHRKEQLRPSLTRQTWGAVFVLVGLALGTVGNVI